MKEFRFCGVLSCTSKIPMDKDFCDFHQKHEDERGKGIISLPQDMNAPKDEGGGPNLSINQEGLKIGDKTFKHLDDGSIYFSPTPKQPIEDIINKPNHYHQGGIDIYEIMQAKMSPEEYKGFCKGNVLKYLLRADLKGKPIEDLKKLRFNTERAIEAYEGIKYVPDYKKKKQG
jgi:Protein of unknwon function (DUF3310)